MKIAPSILSADFSMLGKEIRDVEPYADMLHVDVMDGHFVPNITIGVPVVKSLKKATRLPLDVHLMITNPEKFISAFARAGASIITFHIETTKDPAAVINMIHDEGKKAGITLKPSTPLSEIEPYLDKIDLALVMTVNPGFSGQKFIDGAVQKVKRLSEIKKARGLKYAIQVDGGINDSTVRTVAKAGAEIVVSGSYIFGSPNYVQSITKLKNPL
jgi:ribulose-phosphate 3-epimerase